GGALLAALEKKDAEALSLLRQDQELTLLNAVLSVREKQITEAQETHKGLTQSKETITTKRNYYQSVERISSGETLTLSKKAEAHRAHVSAQTVKLQASVTSLLPGIILGASGLGGSPHATLKIGGVELGQSANLAADFMDFNATQASNESDRAG